MPIDVEGKRLVSLAFVFIISSQLLFGWEWSMLIGALGIGLAMAIDRSEPIKVAFNSAAYALAAGLAALPLLIDGGGRAQLRARRDLGRVGGAIFVVANVADRLRRDRVRHGNAAPRGLPRPHAAVGPDLRDHGLRRGAGRDPLAALGAARAAC